MTTFDNSLHWSTFMFGELAESIERARTSDLVISALRAVGMFDRTTIAGVAPAGAVERDLWLDTSTDPASLKFYNGTAWVAATFDLIWPASGVAATGVTFTAAPVPPAGPALGDWWLDTDEDVIYLRSTDGVTASWIDISSVGSAPNTPQYVPLTGGTMTGSLTAPTITSTSYLKSNAYASPAALPSATAAGAGAIAYCEGMPAAGGTDGLVYSDGTNWRKQRNGNIVA